jgi:hypothetical protein
VKTYIKTIYSKAKVNAFIAAAVAALLSGQVLGFPAEQRRLFFKGPWELAVQMGMEGQSFQFPIKVANEDKSEELDSVLPVMGTPIKIKLVRYLPDLKWETSAVKHVRGGTIAKVKVEGEKLEQEIWLNSEDPSRQSISASIGSVGIRKLHDSNTVEKLLREVIEPNTVGILSVWPEDSNSQPTEHAIHLGETLSVQNSKYKLGILEYVPNYSIDTKTKKVVSLSDKPVNPAVKISVDDGENSHEQWLWSKFPSTPHMQKKLPIRMRFSDFNTGGTDGNYILTAALGSDPWLVFLKDGEPQIQKAELGRSYPFTNKSYSFIIEKVFDNSVIKVDWKNGSESLLGPAIVVNIEENGTKNEALLEFNKPYHQKSKFGTIVLLYRGVQQGMKTTD